ncbi:MAG: hypothetical protein Q4F72_09190 [Desulfovibrionaceae bacterium]|nr:hypothetical protein [Desulfovibrionaceae bacterium]
MTDNFTSMVFSGSLTDPEEIAWQFSLGLTAMDRVADQQGGDMTAVEACLDLLCRKHSADSGRPSAEEEKSLRMLVEDALGSPDFQSSFLPGLVRRAIEANNSSLVTILISYAEDEKKVLALANADPADAAGPAASAGPADSDEGKGAAE